MEIKDETE